jgi:hypothetical protein
VSKKRKGVCIPFGNKGGNKGGNKNENKNEGKKEGKKQGFADLQDTARVAIMQDENKSRTQEYSIKKTNCAEPFARSSAVLTTSNDFSR